MTFRSDPSEVRSVGPLFEQQKAGAGTPAEKERP